MKTVCALDSKVAVVMDDEMGGTSQESVALICRKYDNWKTKKYTKH
jgi:hypothetical protein